MAESLVQHQRTGANPARFKAPLWDRAEVRARLLYEDEKLIVFNKPYDWPTSGRNLRDEDCVQFHLIEYYQQAIWAVHQLDADTSGLCLFTKQKSAATHYHRLLTAPKAVKEYEAIISGRPEWEQKELTLPLGRAGPRSYGIVSLEEGGKEAHSSFEVRERYAQMSLVRVRIHTGRTHQIRIHLSALGHPLIGEEWYIPRACTLHPRQALHASQLFLPSGEHYRAPLAPDLCRLLQAARGG